MLDAHGCSWILTFATSKGVTISPTALAQLHQNVKTCEVRQLKANALAEFSEFSCRSETQLIQHKLTECDHRHLLFVHHGTCKQGLTCTWVTCQDSPNFTIRKITHLQAFKLFEHSSQACLRNLWSGNANVGFINWHDIALMCRHAQRHARWIVSKELGWGHGLWAKFVMSVYVTCDGCTMVYICLFLNVCRIGLYWWSCATVYKKGETSYSFFKPGTFARNGAVEVIKTVTRETSETFWNSIFLAQPCRNTTSIRDIVPQLCAAPAISWKLTLIDHTLSGSSVLVGWILDKDLKVSLIQNSAKQEVDLHIFAVDFFFCVSLRHGDMLHGSFTADVSLMFLWKPSFVPFRRVTFPVSARRPRSK